MKVYITFNEKENKPIGYQTREDARKSIAGQVDTNIVAHSIQAESLSDYALHVTSQTGRKDRFGGQVKYLEIRA
jgi:hypothetical protein